jgi:hypothetical protein
VKLSLAARPTGVAPPDAVLSTTYNVVGVDAPKPIAAFLPALGEAPAPLYRDDFEPLPAAHGAVFVNPTKTSKQPKSAFEIFMEHNRRKMRKYPECQDLAADAFNDWMQEHWQELAQSERLFYEEEAKVDVDKYNRRARGRGEPEAPSPRLSPCTWHPSPAYEPMPTLGPTGAYFPPSAVTVCPCGDDRSLRSCPHRCLPHAHAHQG